MSDENEDSDWDSVITVGEFTPVHVATEFRGDPARANRKYRAAKELREATLERQGQVTSYRTFLDYLQVFERARQAYYLTFARDWRPERGEDHLELFLFCEQIYCELLSYASLIQPVE